VSTNQKPTARCYSAKLALTWKHLHRRGHAASHRHIPASLSIVALQSCVGRTNSARNFCFDYAELHCRSDIGDAFVSWRRVRCVGELCEVVARVMRAEARPAMRRRYLLFRAPVQSGTVCGWRSPNLRHVSCRSNASAYAHSSVINVQKCIVLGCQTLVPLSYGEHTKRTRPTLGILGREIKSHNACISWA
jgi:hypothetical protein